MKKNIYFTNKKSLILLMIASQIFFASNFLFNSVVLAQEESVPAESAPAETEPEITDESETEPTAQPENTVAEPIAAEEIVSVEETQSEITDKEEAEPAESMPADSEDMVPVDYTESPDSPDNSTAEQLLTGDELSPVDENVSREESPAAETIEPIIFTEEELPVFVIGGPISESAPAATDETTGDNNHPIELTLQSAPLIGSRVLVSWSMDNIKNENNEYLGTDDDTAEGGQFMPASPSLGGLNSNKTVAVCAIVINGNGPENLMRVKSEIVYPLINSEADILETAPASAATVDLAQDGLNLTALERLVGYDLFCNKIKNNNNNLPVFGSGMSFDNLCAPGGSLSLGHSLVYCAEKNLAYSDPAGDYQLKISSYGEEGLVSPLAENSFKYLELTAYAVDFNNITYGAVEPHTPKIIAGDLNWDEPLGENPATVSNVGNTKLRLVVKQNDFNLGKTGESWNVGYTARIGDSEFVKYSPEIPTVLNKIMEVGEINQLDFGIEVYNFPAETTAAYSGEMFLSAEKAE